MTTMKPEERFNEIHSQLLDLEQYRRRMRAQEPKHSDPEHDCMECEILGTLDVLRRTIGCTCGGAPPHAWFCRAKEEPSGGK